MSDNNNSASAAAVTIDAKAIDTADNQPANNQAEAMTDAKAVKSTDAANAVAADLKDFNEWAQKRAAVEKARLATAQAMEDSDQYNEAGPFYLAPTPVANSVGFELGVASKNKEAGTVERNGIGFYIRVDSFSDNKLKYNI